MEKAEYSLYKGLQRPLVFKIFKGKFIYWAVGSILAGIVSGGLVGALISSLFGIVTMIGVSMPLLMFTINKQKRGLYDKKRNYGIYIISPKFHSYRHGNKTGL